MSSLRRPTVGHKAGAVPPPAIAPVDLLTLLGLPVLAAIAWATPEGWWRPLTAAAARLAVRSPEAPRARHIAAVIGKRRLVPPPVAIARELVAGHIEENLQLLRAWRPDGWRPVLRLEGAEHLTAALAAGRGAVLWVAHTAFGSLVVKMALDAAGVQVVHLSHPRHGFSGTRFGRAVLNPIRTRIERRHLAERVVMHPDNPVAALRALRARLAQGGIVSITAREGTRSDLAVPFLAGRLRLATGAPDLAFATGAALLPVFCRREADGGFAVIVDPPLPVPREGDRAAATTAAAAAYAAALERHVAAAPGQWRGWRRCVV